MSERRVYWKSKEGSAPPSNARFFLFPFEGEPIDLGVLARSPLQPPSYYKGTPHFSPDKKTWRKQIDCALKAPLEKLVLARKCQIEYNDPLHPFAICASLEKKATGAAVFCLETPDFSLVGASPERLFRRVGKEIYVDAMAGTRKRGNSPEEDEALKQQLLQSAKDKRENLPVQEFLKKALEPFVETPVQFSPLTVHSTATVQHLYAQGTAQLKSPISDLLLVERLHPTPALAGFPVHTAREQLKTIETFDRGLYGGVFGWMTPEESDWMVIIRSAILHKTLATLFSGTGIVEGSNPDLEWEELNDKLGLFKGILL